MIISSMSASFLPNFSNEGNVDVWLATMFALINTASGMPIRITKNLHVCVDCHSWVKIVSKNTGTAPSDALQCSALDGPVLDLITISLALLDLVPPCD
ncbi:hypothetical protein VitviT2T_021016 [Vitis vinifera]|uniref:DYW domain-containing protein n=1 Tax=Vitis vinifera TaxID=29760 RepID=A0ABY9D7T6_VITVI|nr:hypothetical protein VitviT2T_021016 [Vitis vinifera]